MDELNNGDEPTMSSGHHPIPGRTRQSAVSKVGHSTNLQLILQLFCFVTMTTFNKNSSLTVAAFNDSLRRLNYTQHYNR